MPLPMPLEPPTTRTCFALKSSSFISPRSFFLHCLTSLEIGASLVNPGLHASFSEYSMSDFKQLSRSVAGLTVLVTGAAGGMGRATARVFAAEGAKVAVTDFTTDGAQAVAGEIVATGGTARAWTLDVANRDDINAIINDIAAHFGGLDIVVNNAGISVRTATMRRGRRDLR